MRKITLSIVALATMASMSSASDDFGESLKNGKFSVDARAFYFNRDYDKSAGREALAVGGTIKYESKAFNGLKIGTAYSTSNLVGDTTNRNRSKWTGLTQANTENINFVSQAYLQYDAGNTMVKIGRQVLNTPIFTGHDIRMVPTSYEAAIVRNKDIANTVIEAGYIVSTSGWASMNSGFDKNEEMYSDDGVGYLYLTNTSVKDLRLRAFYAMTMSDTYNKNGVTTDTLVTDYQYADVKYKLPFGKNTYVMANYAGNSYQNEADSMMYGVAAGTSFGIFSVFAGFEQIKDNDFKGDQCAQIYTDYQQGYNNYGPSTAYGLVLSAKPMEKLSVAVKGAWISADEYKDTNLDSSEDFNEYNLDATYAINDWSKIRFRYSMKDQSNASGNDDRNDFRTIYYVKF